MPTTQREKLNSGFASGALSGFPVQLPTIDPYARLLCKVIDWLCYENRHWGFDLSLVLKCALMGTICCIYTLNNTSFPGCWVTKETRQHIVFVCVCLWTSPLKNSLLEEPTEGCVLLETHSKFGYLQMGPEPLSSFLMKGQRSVMVNGHRPKYLMQFDRHHTTNQSQETWSWLFDKMPQRHCCIVIILNTELHKQFWLTQPDSVWKEICLKGRVARLQMHKKCVNALTVNSTLTGRLVWFPGYSQFLNP